MRPRCSSVGPPIPHAALLACRPGPAQRSALRVSGRRRFQSRTRRDTRARLLSHDDACCVPRLTAVFALARFAVRDDLTLWAAASAYAALPACERARRVDCATLPALLRFLWRDLPAPRDVSLHHCRPSLVGAWLAPDARGVAERTVWLASIAGLASLAWAAS
jgi:hypothetical protein